MDLIVYAQHFLRSTVSFCRISAKIIHPPGRKKVGGLVLPATT
jgi:hypothetical protein